jgi:hypothetical protein
VVQVVEVVVVRPEQVIHQVRTEEMVELKEVEEVAAEQPQIQEMVEMEEMVVEEK